MSQNQDDLPDAKLTLEEVDDGRDVPLEAQTQESLIAYIKTLEGKEELLHELREACPTKTIGAGRNGESDYVMVRGSEWDSFQKKIAEIDKANGPQP